MNIIIVGQENHEIRLDNVRTINIYGDGEILFQTDHNSFEEYETNSKGIYTSVYNSAILSVNLAKEPVRAIKENLNRKDNYFKKHHGSYSWQTGIDLYIHESEISVTDDGEKLAVESDKEKCFFRAYTLKFKHGATVRRNRIEKILNAGKDWTPPAGGIWSDKYGTIDAPCYDTFSSKLTGESGVIKRWWETETLFTMPTKTGPYCRIEYSAERIRAKELAKYINENRIFYKEVSGYEIEKLLEYFELTKKEAK